MAGIDDLDQWLNQHGAALLMFARQLVQNHADAEDVVQDAFVRCWRSQAQVTDRIAYLYACVRNAAIDHRRGHARRLQREQAAAVSESSPPLFVQDGEQEELRVSVQAALADLPQEQAEVLIMKIWGQLTFAQIAEVLAISPNTAASRYRYAAQALRQTLRHEVQS